MMKAILHLCLSVCMGQSSIEYDGLSRLHHHCQNHQYQHRPQPQRAISESVPAAPKQLTARSRISLSAGFETSVLSWQRDSDSSSLGLRGGGYRSKMKRQQRREKDRLQTLIRKKKVQRMKIRRGKPIKVRQKKMDVDDVGTKWANQGMEAYGKAKIFKGGMDDFEPTVYERARQYRRTSMKRARRKLPI